MKDVYDEYVKVVSLSLPRTARLMELIAEVTGLKSSGLSTSRNQHIGFLIPDSSYENDNDTETTV